MSLAVLLLMLRFTWIISQNYLNNVPIIIKFNNKSLNSSVTPSYNRYFNLDLLDTRFSLDPLGHYLRTSNFRNSSLAITIIPPWHRDVTTSIKNIYHHNTYRTCKYFIILFHITSIRYRCLIIVVGRSILSVVRLY